MKFELGQKVKVKVGETTWTDGIYKGLVVTGLNYHKVLVRNKVNYFLCDSYSVKKFSPIDQQLIDQFYSNNHSKLIELVNQLIDQSGFNLSGVVVENEEILTRWSNISIFPSFKEIESLVEFRQVACWNIDKTVYHPLSDDVSVYTLESYTDNLNAATSFFENSIIEFVKQKTNVFKESFLGEQL
jgi:hypothetical protein